MFLDIRGIFFNFREDISLSNFDKCLADGTRILLCVLVGYRIYPS
jgi:hypothetical protein